jgi:hypothetical protein
VKESMSTMKIQYCLVIAIMTHESITLDLVFSNKMERQSVYLPFLSSTPRACARRKMRVRCVPCPKVMGLYQIKKHGKWTAVYLYQATSSWIYFLKQKISAWTVLEQDRNCKVHQVLLHKRESKVVFFSQITAPNLKIEGYDPFSEMI